MHNKTNAFGVKNFKKPVLSAVVFFSTLIALSVGYATWNNAMTTVGTGSGLTSTSWNAMVDNINDLSSRSWGQNGLASYYTTGNVGIGTTGPSQKLEVASSYGDPATSGTTQNGILRVANSNDNSVLDIGIRSSGLGAWIQATDRTSLGTYRSLLLNPNGGNVGIGKISFGGIRFFVSNSSDNAWTTYMESTSPTVGQNYGLTVRAGTNSTDAGFLVMDKNSSVYQFIVRGDGNVGIGAPNPAYKLQVMGSVASNSTVLTSDKRYKKNIIPIDNSLDKVLKLNGVNFEWRTNEFKNKNFPEGKQMGFIAQEVEKVIPEVVTTDGEGYKGVEYPNITALLVNAIKEQQKQIEELKSKIEILENK